MAGERRRALIVGASRGLGLGLVRAYLDRGWDVVATARGRNEDALQRLRAEAGGRLAVDALEVTDDAAIRAMARRLGPTRLDLLFVSAGISGDKAAAAATVDPDAFARMMATNAHAPLRIIEALGGNVPVEGAVVAMSSVLGSVASNVTGGYEAYRASKAALNTLLRSYAVRHAARAVIAMHPGWVRTDMAGPDATLDVAESARGMADVIDAHMGRAGCVFVDWQGRTIPW